MRKRVFMNISEVYENPDSSCVDTDFGPRSMERASERVRPGRTLSHDDRDEVVGNELLALPSEIRVPGAADSRGGGDPAQGQCGRERSVAAIDQINEQGKSFHA